MCIFLLKGCINLNVNYFLYKHIVLCQLKKDFSKNQRGTLKMSFKLWCCCYCPIETTTMFNVHMYPTTAKLQFLTLNYYMELL